MSDDRQKVEWVVRDPLDRPVTLSTVRKMHILDGHPEFMVSTYLEALPGVIQAPHMILYDRFDFDMEIFCSLGLGLGPFSGQWLKVPVRYDISDTGSVVTAYFTPKTPEGKIKWLPPSMKK